MSKKIFYGWWIVASGFVLLFLYLGAGFYSFSIFIKPLEDYFGWTRASISLTMSIFFIVGGLVAPLIGKLIQVYGPKKVMAFSSVGAGACFMLVTLTHSLWYFYAVYAFLALTFCGMGVLPVSSLLASWFNKRRGTATGLAMVGISAGGLILAPVVGSITALVGWKAAYFFLGLLVWSLALPVVFFVIKDSPSELGIDPDGDGSTIKTDRASSDATVNISPATEIVGWPLGKAFRSRAFWWIATSFSLASFAHLGVMQHQVPIIVDTGTSQATAAIALGLVAGIGGVGKLSFGRIFELLPFGWVIMLCFGLQALGVFVLLHTQTLTMVWIYVVIFGFAMGGEVVLLPLGVGKYFGLASFDVILGTLWMIQSVGAALGPYVAGLVYDFLGSYQYALYAFMTAYLTAIIAIFLAGKPNLHAPRD